MNKIILQPAGNGVGKLNFERTIINKIPLEVILNHIKNGIDRDYLKSIYPDGYVPVWGVTPGKNNVNLNKWEKVETGDVTLFTGNMKVNYSGVVTYKFQARELALELWGLKDETQTWEYIYLLDEIKSHNISIQTLNVLAGYSMNYSVQGFLVMDEQKSTRILEELDLKSDIYFEAFNKKDFEHIVKKLEDSGSLEIESKINRRKEQAMLRRYLFDNKKESKCAICNKSYPVEFLVTAHIKKRSKCELKEKLDYKNIVVPMCKFGCDELYEKGHISVENGDVIQLSETKKINSNIKRYIEDLLGKKCEYWNIDNQDYFKWHKNFHMLSSRLIK